MQIYDENDRRSIFIGLMLIHQGKENSINGTIARQVQQEMLFSGIGVSKYADKPSKQVKTAVQLPSAVVVNETLALAQVILRLVPFYCIVSIP